MRNLITKIRQCSPKSCGSGDSDYEYYATLFFSFAIAFILFYLIACLTLSLVDFQKIDADVLAKVDELTVRQMGFWWKHPRFFSPETDEKTIYLMGIITIPFFSMAITSLLLFLRSRIFWMNKKFFRLSYYVGV
ncbi:MAG: hypothetical protein HQK53_18570, partial [Oligoflexia bacterium]|nr:hypothetical protein [Oligoflexia bacterium]